MNERNRDSLDRITTPPRAASAIVADLGTAIGTGVVAALLGSLPAALRLSDAGGANRAWLLLAGAATPFAAVSVFILRDAYGGLRAYMGEQRSFVRVFVALWLGTVAASLDALGRVLRATTHHHALAGVTFALAAVMVVVGAGLATHRAARLIDGLRGRGLPRLHALLTTAVYALVAGMLLMAARHLHGKLPAESAATMVDVTALALSAALAARPEFRGFRSLAIFGPLAAVAIVVVGLMRLSPELGALVSSRAPAFGVFLHILGAVR